MNTLHDRLKADVNKYSRNMPRSLQKQIGVSDIGGCREYARLKITEVPPTDDRDKWAAFVGTAIHAEMDKAIKYVYGSKVLIDHKVEVEYPNGAVMPGHPDWVFPEENLIVDIKTVDGLHAIRKSGPTNRQWMQVMGYAKAVMEEGNVNPDKPIRCVLLYVDRSARESDFEVFEREYDPLVIAEADDWITDVIYAVRNDEPASKDKPIDWCERFCEFFTVCRAGDAAPEGGLIEDPEVISAVDLYLEGATLERKGKAMKNEAKGHLEGIEGSTGTATVRWTVVSPTEVPGYVRDGYKKLNVRAR